MIRKESWELTLEERLERVIKRVPAYPNMNDEIVKTASSIPIYKRQYIRNYLDVLIYRLNRQLYWWEKVRDELDKKPEMKAVKWNECQ